MASMRRFLMSAFLAAKENDKSKPSGMILMRSQ